MSNFNLIIDVFEGSDLLDLQKLKENNIQYVMVRLGAYHRFGGLMGNRKDDLFDKQWALLNTDLWFKKIVYMPYNPWRTWEYNLKFLLDNIPSDCNGVELDVENKRTLNYTPKTYGAEFGEYYNHIPSNIQKIIYTGEAFLEYMYTWPKGNYSWAQYPYSLRPSDSAYWSWDQLREKLSKFIGPYNQNKAPDRVVAWQFTGDKVILDGSDKGMDVYAWLGTQEELDKLFGSDSPIITPPPIDDDPEIPTSNYTGRVLSTATSGLKIRDNAVDGNQIGLLQANEYFEADKLELYSGGKWFHVTFPVQGYIASWWTKYTKNDVVVEPPTDLLPPPQIGRNRIKHDVEMSKYNFQSRLNLPDANYKQDAYPETLRWNSNSNKSSLDLSENWQKFLQNINTAQAYKFMQVPESGWHNGGIWPRVEYLSFGGNFVEVTRIDGDKCYIKHYSNDQLPPNTNSDFYDDTLIQLFSVTRKNNTVESPPVGLVRTLIISRASDEELWIDKSNLTFVGTIPPKPEFPKIITVNYGMNLREFHSIDAKIVGRIPALAKTQIEEIFQDGNNYWGRVGLNSWLCLKLNGQYFSNWRE